MIGGWVTVDGGAVGTVSLGDGDAEVESVGVVVSVGETLSVGVVVGPPWATRSRCPWG